jgi:hypothetical protein
VNATWVEMGRSGHSASEAEQTKNSGAMMKRYSNSPPRPALLMSCMI